MKNMNIIVDTRDKYSQGTINKSLEIKDLDTCYRALQFDHPYSGEPTIIISSLKKIQYLFR